MPRCSIIRSINLPGDTQLGAFSIANLFVGLMVGYTWRKIFSETKKEDVEPSISSLNLGRGQGLTPWSMSMAHARSNRFTTSLQAVDGRVKTLLCLTAIVIAVILRHWYLAAGMMLAATVLLLWQRYPMKMLLLRLIIPFGVAWLVLVSFLLTYGHTEIGCITIWHWAFPMYLEGLERGIHHHPAHPGGSLHHHPALDHHADDRRSWPRCA